MSTSWRRSMDLWFSTHLGIINASKLAELGCSDRNIGKMDERRELVTMLPGVFRSAQWPCDREQVVGAICARNEAAMIGFTTAGQEWTYRRMIDPLVHVLITHGCSPVMEGVVIHRCRRIDPVDIVQRPDGIRLTSPPRTIFDSADMIGSEATASVIEQVLNEQRVTFETLTDTLHRLYHPNRPGSKTMLAVLRSGPPWRGALQWDWEVRVIEEMARRGLPPPVPQCPMTLPDGRNIVIDFAWPGVKLAVEVDHPAWHDGARDSHADKGRDRKLTTIGWTSARITDIDVNGGLRDAVSDISRILQRLTAA